MIFFIIIFLSSVTFIHFESKKHQRKIAELLHTDYSRSYDDLKKMLGGKKNDGN